MIGLYDSWNQTDPGQCCSWACRGWQSPASFCLSARPQRKLWEAACSSHTMSGPCLPHTSGAAAGGHICHCLRIVKVPWCRQQQPRPVPRPRDSEASQSLFCVLHSLRERLKAWYFQPAFGKAPMAHRPVGTMQMFTLVPGRGQPVGFQERCSPIAWAWSVL